MSVLSELLIEAGLDADPNKLKISDLPTLGINMLETMSEVHDCTYDIYNIMKRGQDQAKTALAIKGVKQRESLIVDRIMIWYKLIMAVRSKYRDIVMSNPSLMQQERVKCASDMKHFINMWAYVHEPRMNLVTSKGERVPTNIPFILYPAQERVVEDINMCFETRQDGIIGKSREAGISWGFCAWGTWKWLFNEGFQMGVGSEKADKVDTKGSTNTLFGKFRYIIYGLPDFLRPSGYRKNAIKGTDGKRNPYDCEMKLINNDTNSTVLGEQGEEIGRGGRYSIFIIDESQVISSPEKVASALEAATPCRIDVGTPNGMNHFGQKWFSNAIKNIQIMWYEDPRKTKHWRSGKHHRNCSWRKFVEEKNSDNPAKVAQEYDLDFQGSITDLCIPADWVRSCIEADIPMCDNPDNVSGFDVAGGGGDEAVYINKRGNKILTPKVYMSSDVIDSMIEAHNNTVADKARVLFYDAVAIGESMFGTITRLEQNIPYVLTPIKGQSSATNRFIAEEEKVGTEAYYNRRAELWCNLRRLIHNTHRYVTGVCTSYSPDELISLPNDKHLIEQLSYPKLLKKNGRKLVESKEDMRMRGLRSPDRADACAYACAESTNIGSERAVGKFVANADFFKKIKVQYAITQGWEYYVSVFRSDINETASLLIRFHQASKQIEVVGEMVEQNPTPVEIMSAFENIIAKELLEKATWVARNKILKNVLAGTGYEEANMYRQAGIKLQFNQQDDDISTLVFLNALFGERRISISYDCREVTSQLSAVEINASKIDQRFPLVLALMQCVGLLKQKKKMDVTRVFNQGYGQRRVDVDKLVKTAVLERIK